MKLPAFAFLFLSSVSFSAAWAKTEATSSQGRSAYTSPSTENAFDFQSDQLAAAETAQPVQIVVQKVGTFPGWQNGESLELTLPPTSVGPHYDLTPEPDYLQLVTPSAQIDSTR